MQVTKLETVTQGNVKIVLLIQDHNKVLHTVHQTTVRLTKKSIYKANVKHVQLEVNLIKLELIVFNKMVGTLLDVAEHKLEIQMAHAELVPNTKLQ